MRRPPGFQTAHICTRCFQNRHDQCQQRVKGPGHRERVCICCGKDPK